MTSTEIKDKILSWWGFKLFMIMIGSKIAGIAGGIGFSIIASGVEKTTKNSKYSKNKKNIYSILYCLCGIVTTIILLIAITLIIRNYFGANIISPTNIEQNYQTPSGYQIYKNPKTTFSAIAYPNNWTVKEDYDEFSVFFESPDKNSNITASEFLQDKNEKINFKTYTFDTFSEEALKEIPRIKLEKTFEQIKNINGKDWLIYDYITTLNGVTVYNRAAILTTDKYNGLHGIQFMLESEKNNFKSSSAIFDTMLESTRLYN